MSAVQSDKPYLAGTSWLLAGVQNRGRLAHLSGTDREEPRVVCWQQLYLGADKSLARPTSRCILFDGENISFDASLVIYINSTNIPPIMIVNRIYETQNLLSL